MASSKGISLQGIVDAGIGLVTGWIAGLLKGGKAKARINDINAQADYVAGKDAANVKTLKIVIVLAVVLVASVVYFFILKRKR